MVRPTSSGLDLHVTSVPFLLSIVRLSRQMSSLLLHQHRLGSGDARRLLTGTLLAIVSRSKGLTTREIDVPSSWTNIGGSSVARLALVLLAHGEMVQQGDDLPKFSGWSQRHVKSR